jgi:dipeptidyl aminopeptidase/acylaminoacyl peptidase
MIAQKPRERIGLPTPGWAITAAVVLALLTSPPGPARAQGTKVDYERAKALDERTRNTVFRTPIAPRWNEAGDRFWYRVRTGPQEHEFIVVDVKRRSRAPAFEHTRMAEALGRALSRHVEATSLPIDGIEFAGEGPELLVHAGGKSWRYVADSHELREEKSASLPEILADRNAPLASLSTGEETSIVFENRTAGEVSLFWLDPEGEPRSYGKIAPGARHEQHTFAGHVWRVVDAGGRELARAQATDEPRLVAVSGSLIEVVDEAREAEPRRRRGRRDEGAATSPDGSWRAFIRDSNVWVRGANGAQEFRLSDDGTQDDAYRGQFHWSPDSRYLLVLQVKPEERREVTVVESSPRDQIQPKVHTFQYLKPGDRIARPRPRLFDVTTKTSICIEDDLFENPWSIDRLRWAPDSRSFTFLYNQRGHQILRVVSVDACSGKARTLIEEKSPTFIDYAHKTYLHWLSDGNEVIWMSERDGWNHLWLYDAAKGEVKNQITRGEWVVRRVVRVDEEARQVWFYACGAYPDQDPYYEHLCRSSLDGNDFVILTEGDGTHRVEFSPKGNFLIDTWSRVDHPPVTELRDAESGSLICVLESADSSGLEETGWTVPERFAAKGRDGKSDIHGIIIRPSRFDPARKYPVIEEIYAGPQGAFVPKAWNIETRKHALAELGFVVVQIDGMGTNWRSKAFHDVCWKNLGDAGFPDRIAWLKAAAADRPWMDLERVGIFGGSAGGQNALRGLLAHGDFYKVGAADCGCHDNRMDKIWWNELWMGWPVGPEYEASSNVTLASRLSGKLLLVVGELDRNVDPASTMQVVNALVKADKDFDLLIVPGAGHGAGASPYGRRRIADFFVRHLLGVEPRREPAE